MSGTIIRWSCAVALGVALGACGATYSPHVRVIQGPPPPVAADPGMATIAFVNPTGLGWDAYVRILDEEGRYVCDVSANSYCVAQVSPGAHVFVARGSQAMTDEYGALRAEVVAGAVYAVQTMAIGEGPWACLNAVSPENRTTASRDWPRILRTSTRLEPDAAAAQAAEDQRGRLTREQVERHAETTIHHMTTSTGMPRGCAGAGLFHLLRPTDALSL